MNYDRIVDPLTGKKISIKTKNGKKILKNYINFLKGGSNYQGVFSKDTNPIDRSEFYLDDSLGFDINFNNSSNLLTEADFIKSFNNAKYNLNIDTIDINKWNNFTRKNLIANEDALEKEIGENFKLTKANEFLCRQQDEQNSLLATYYNLDIKQENKIGLNKYEHKRNKTKRSKVFYENRQKYKYCVKNLGSNIQELNESWITVVTLKDKSNHAHESLINLFNSYIKDSSNISLIPPNYPNKKDLDKYFVIPLHIPIFHSKKTSADWEKWKKCSGKDIKSTRRVWEKDCADYYNGAHGTFVSIKGDIEATLLEKFIKYGKDTMNWDKSSVRNQHKRIFKLLGLNPAWGNYDTVLTFDIQVKDLIRICYNSDVMADECLIEPGRNNDNKEWIEQIQKNNLDKGRLSNAPFTGLGYTYDIQNVRKAQFTKLNDFPSKNTKATVTFNDPISTSYIDKVKGIHEFIVPWGAKIKNLKTTAIKIYLNNITRRVTSELSFAETIKS